MEKKIVLVTGVSSGIGRASARALADADCIVYGSVRDLENAEPIKGVTLVQLDVREQSSVDQAIAAVVAKEGRPGRWMPACARPSDSPEPRRVRE